MTSFTPPFVPPALHEAAADKIGLDVVLSRACLGRLDLDTERMLVNMSDDLSSERRAPRSGS